MKWHSLPAFAALVLAAGVVGESAAASVSARTLAHPAAPVAHLSGTIGTAAPGANARALLRAAGLDDGSGSDGVLGVDNGDSGGLGSDDGGSGGLAGGKVAHGAIGSALPLAGAAAGIRALGLDD